MGIRRGTPSVAVLGGGVGGMSAAHELVERGFRVTIYEAKQTQGGKARSIFVPGTGTTGRRGLPGEHGFRFFPSFYRHLPDTMKRIPFGQNANGVFDNLVGTDRTRVLRTDGQWFDMVTHFPLSLDDIRTMHPDEWYAKMGIPTEDIAGDAAGVDPLYGEGISFALGYGEAAADAIAAAFDRGRFDFADYAKRVRRHPLLGQLPVRARVARLGKRVNDPRAIALLWSLGSWALQYTRWNDGSYVPAADAHWLLRA